MSKKISVIIAGNLSTKIRQEIQALLPENYMLVETSPLHHCQEIKAAILTAPKPEWASNRFKGEVWRGKGKRKRNQGK